MASQLTIDMYDYYTFDHDKHMFSGRSGKQRSKREVAVHTNRPDPSGHSRKLSTKLRNTEQNQNKARLSGLSCGGKRRPAGTSTAKFIRMD